MAVTTEQRIKRIITKHSLRTVQLTFGSGVSARALPDNFNPLVAKRRETGLADASTKGATLSMAEAEAIVNGAMMKPVGEGMGSDIDAALTSLEMALARAHGAS